MEITSKSFFSIDDFIPPKRFISFGDLAIKFTEKTSSQSDTQNPHEYWLRDFSILQHPDGALAVILALSYTRPGWSSAEYSEKLLTHIHRIARNHGFQGGWRKVGEVLQHDLYRLGIRGILSEIVKDMSPETFYGNFLRKVYSVIEKNLKVRNQFRPYRELNKKERYRGIHRKIRRRGYDDKGSLQPNSAYLHEEKKDLWIVEKENRRQEKLQEFQLKLPPPRYWYQSQFGVGSNDSTKRRKE